MRTEYFMIAEVLRPQGVHGEAKLRSWAEDPGAFARWDTLYLRDGESYVPVACRGGRVRDGFVYAVLGDCRTPEDVEKLRGRELYIDRAHASPLAPGECYQADLMGCTAVTREGVALGELVDILNHGPVPVYVFRTPRGEMMAPALPDVFVEKDIDHGRILVDSARLQEVAVFAD